jgi:hypothetical protein
MRAAATAHLKVWLLPWLIVVALAAVALTLWAWQSASARPLFLAATRPDQRLSFYSTTASTSGALLGLTIAALSILAALPDSERATRLRELPGWRSLRGSLLTTGAMLLLALSSCTIGIVIDAQPTANSRMCISTAASIAAALLGVLLTGMQFGLALTGLDPDA